MVAWEQVFRLSNWDSNLFTFYSPLIKGSRNQIEMDMYLM